jgi:hypothetical protein
MRRRKVNKIVYLSLVRRMRGKHVEGDEQVKFLQLLTVYIPELLPLTQGLDDVPNPETIMTNRRKLLT